jgi:hypothetical protein
MCVVSNVGDMGRDMWPKPWDNQPWANPPWKTEPMPRPYEKPVPMPGIDYPIPNLPKPYTGPTREQFEEFLKLLRAARDFDKATGQPNCEQDEKVKWIRELAEFLGVDPAKVSEILK